jgi:hypothetical protein
MDNIAQCPRTSRAKQARLYETKWRQVVYTYKAAIEHETHEALANTHTNETRDLSQALANTHTNETRDLSQAKLSVNV